MQFQKAIKQIINKQKRKKGTLAYYSNGTVYFSRIFGYSLINGRYEPDSRYSDAIEIIYELLSDGKSLPSIKQELDKMGARDSSHNRYNISRIIAIAERPIYAGYLKQGRRFDQIKNVDPIVSLDKWKAVQKILNQEKKRLIAQ
jgi:hypothetical protein